MTKIFINPGHSKDGRPDCGCAYNGIKECDIARSISEKLELYLRSNGFDTQLYQQTGYDNNANKQLNSVASLANQSRSNLFISIHMNGFNNSNAKGTETLFMNGSQKGKKFAELVNNELIKPYQDYTFVNRGIKVDTRGLAVLKYTNMPAVLTEIGFISNTIECQMIIRHQDEIAKRLCKAICNYFDRECMIEERDDEISENLKAYPRSILLSHLDNDKYDVAINDELKLRGNKLLTCLEWIKKNYE